MRRNREATGGSAEPSEPPPRRSTTGRILLAADGYRRANLQGPLASSPQPIGRRLSSMSATQRSTPLTSAACAGVSISAESSVSASLRRLSGRGIANRLQPTADSEAAASGADESDAGVSSRHQAENV